MRFKVYLLINTILVIREPYFKSLTVTYNGVSLYCIASGSLKERTNLVLMHILTLHKLLSKYGFSWKDSTVKKMYSEHQSQHIRIVDWSSLTQTLRIFSRKSRWYLVSTSALCTQHSGIPQPKILIFPPSKFPVLISFFWPSLMFPLPSSPFVRFLVAILLCWWVRGKERYADVCVIDEESR